MNYLFKREQFIVTAIHSGSYLNAEAYFLFSNIQLNTAEQQFAQLLINGGCLHYRIKDDLWLLNSYETKNKAEEQIELLLNNSRYSHTSIEDESKYEVGDTLTAIINNNEIDCIIVQKDIREVLNSSYEKETSFSVYGATLIDCSKTERKLSDKFKINLHLKL